MSLSRLASQHVARSGFAASIEGRRSAVAFTDLTREPLPFPNKDQAGRDAAPGDPALNAGEAVKRSNASDDRYDRLTKYIPTETISLFVAAMAILPNLQGLNSNIKADYVVAAFTALTPILLIVIDLGKHRMDPTSGPYRPEWWPLVAATIAFFVWAHSVGGVVNEEATNAKIIWAFAAATVSGILSLGDPLFGPRPPVQK